MMNTCAASTVLGLGQGSLYRNSSNLQPPWQLQSALHIAVLLELSIIQKADRGRRWRSLGAKMNPTLRTPRCSFKQTSIDSVRCTKRSLRLGAFLLLIAAISPRPRPSDCATRQLSVYYHQDAKLPLLRFQAVVYLSTLRPQWIGLVFLNCAAG